MTPTVIIVVAALITRKGRLLICQRRADDALGLKWEFPGGKVQAGETLQAALARELKEELDIRAEIGERVHSTTFAYGELGRIVELHFFCATIPADAPLRNLTFEQIAWAEAAALPSYDFLPADRELVGRIARGELLL